MGTLPSRDPARTAKHKNLIFTFFCNKGNSMSLGQNWQKVLRLVPKQKNQKMHFEITIKCCEYLKIHGQLAKLGLQMNSSQQQFLNKRKRPQLKIQTPKRFRYLLHYFGQKSNTYLFSTGTVTTGRLLIVVRVLPI